MASVYRYEQMAGNQGRRPWYSVCDLKPLIRVSPLPTFSVHAFWGCYNPEPLFMRTWRAYRGRTDGYKFPEESYNAYEQNHHDWIVDMLDWVGSRALKTKQWGTYLSNDEIAFCRHGAFIAQTQTLGTREVAPEIKPEILLAATLVLSYAMEIGKPTLKDYCMAGQVPYNDAHLAFNALEAAKGEDGQLQENPYELAINQMKMSSNQNVSDVANCFEDASIIPPTHKATLEPPDYLSSNMGPWTPPSDGMMAHEFSDLPPDFEDYDLDEFLDI